MGRRIDKEEFLKIYMEHLEMFTNLERPLKDTPESRGRIWTSLQNISDIVQSSAVSRLDLIHAIIEGSKRYPDTNGHVFGNFIRHVGEGSISLIGNYPELLWFIDSTNMLREPTSVGLMFDNTQLMIDICGRELTRHYLNYLVITSSTEKAKLIIPSYYYTGHNVESLQLVLPVISDDDELMERAYHDVYSPLSLKRMGELSQADIDFLIEFFTEGLAHPNPNINRYSKDSLSNLKTN